MSLPQGTISNGPFRFALFGATLDTGNMGVSALAASTIELILHNRPESEIKLFIGNRSADSQKFLSDGFFRHIPVINFRWSPKAKFHEHLLVIFFLACLWRIAPVQPLRQWILKSNRWLREIAASDIAGDICGGDSFSDIYGVRRFALTTLPVIVAVVMGTPLYFLPQTYGPFRHPFSKWIARWVMLRATAIMSRDKDSIRLITKLLGSTSRKPPITFCPDVAFTLTSIPIEHPAIEPPLVMSPAELLIGFNVNGLMFNGGYSQDNMFGLKLDYRKFAFRLVRHLLEKTPCRILLIPHTFGEPGNINSDPDACRSVMHQLPRNFQDRVHMVAEHYDQSAIKSIIGRCDLFIGSRMHACIAALSQSIPTFGIAYSKKFLGVFRSVGATDWVLDARVLDTEEIIERVVEATHKIPELKILFKNDFSSVQYDINKAFKAILG